MQQVEMAKRIEMMTTSKGRKPAMNELSFHSTTPYLSLLSYSYTGLHHILRPRFISEGIREIANFSQHKTRTKIHPMKSSSISPTQNNIKKQKGIISSKTLASSLPAIIKSSH
jgi:hypothetical protein